MPVGWSGGRKYGIVTVRVGWGNKEDDVAYTTAGPFFAMQTGEWNDFGESFFGPLRLVAARTRSQRKSPDGDVCCPTSSVENFGCTTYRGAHPAPETQITK